MENVGGTQVIILFFDLHFSLLDYEHHYEDDEEQEAQAHNHHDHLDLTFLYSSQVKNTQNIKNTPCVLSFATFALTKCES